MWKLKYEYVHSDCRYTPKTRELDVTVSTFPLNNFTKNKGFYLTAIHILSGKPQNVKKYMLYLKKISEKSEQITSNIIFTQIKTKRNIKYYKSFYNPSIIYPSPMIHKKGKEHIEIASFDRKTLSDILELLEKNKNTEMLKVLGLKEEKIKDIFLMKTIPKITKKQRRAFELAQNSGYYNYPRKTNLKELAKAMKVSKSNFHEILRRAESNIFNYNEA